MCGNYGWRENEASRRDKPAKRVLRDDLIVELARRKMADAKQIRALRGLEYGRLQQHIPAISDSIELALALPESDLPQRIKRDTTPQINLLSQFLTTALSSVCRSAKVAPSLVGTNQDIRDLISYHLDMNGARREGPPALARGWRAEVVGQQINNLLDGKVSIRIAEPLSDHPLEFKETRE